MKIDNLDKMTAGWFIGNFDPAAHHTADFEVAIKEHPKGEQWDIHYHKVGTEINCLVEGSMTICGKKLKPRDIFTIFPNEIANPVFHEDCKIVTVKIPSKPEDKYTISRNDYDNMIKIAHRGNYKERNEDLENTEEYIIEAIRLGYHCEVDVWFEDNKYFLGHDKPEQETKLEFLKNNKIICHAKSADTALEISRHRDIHYFCHDKDFMTITSKGWQWVYPEVYKHGKLIGFCSDRLL